MKTNNNPALIMLRFLIAATSLFIIANAVFGQTKILATVAVEDLSTQPIYATPSITISRLAPNENIAILPIGYLVTPSESLTRAVNDWAVFGQMADGPAVISEVVPDSPLPSSQSEIWTYIIAVLSPLIIGGLKKAVPAIPKWALPVSAPFVGLLLGLGLKALNWADLSWVDYGQAGALAVWIREMFNKTITAPLKGEHAAKTKDPEDVAKERGKL